MHRSTKSKNRDAESLPHDKKLNFIISMTYTIKSSGAEWCIFN